MKQTLRRHWMLPLVLAFAGGAVAFATPVTYQELRAGDEAMLKKEFPRLSENPDQATLDEALRRLMGGGAYENVFVERAGDGSYQIIGKPLRTVEDVQFQGVRKVDESDLRELLEFKVGDRFDRKKAVAAGERMKNYYGEHGFFNTVIEINFQKTDDKNIRVVYTVQEKDPCVIKGLTFEVVNTDLRQLLESKFKKVTGHPLTTDRIHRLIRDLEDVLIENRYLATEIAGPDAKYNPEKTEAYLQIEVREPYRWEFYFEGNVAFTTTDVYRALDLHNRERRNVDPANEGSERLRRAYLDRGFPNTQIETRVLNANGSYLKRVYYKITENPRVKIKAIEIQGRVSRKSSYYQDFILSHSSDLVQQGYYNRQDLENGFKNLTTELRNQGFLHVRVLSSRVEYNDAKDKVTVYLMLEEGPQTQIRGLDFAGNKFISSYELAEVTKLETNTPLRLDQFEESINRLKNFYHDQGFLEMKLLNEGEDLIQYNDKGTQARLVFQIYEGPRIRIHSISVQGTQQTKPRVVLQEANFKLGEILTPKKMDDATARLNKMNLFSRVDIRTLEEGTTVSERTVVISITEREPGLFTFGGGVTNERNLTLRGFTAMSYNNLGGTARAVSGRAELRSNVGGINYPESEFTVGYMEPFLFNTRTRGRVNLTRSDYVFNYEPAYHKMTEINIKNKLDLLLERDLTQHTKLTYKLWSLESRKDYERYGRCLIDTTHEDPSHFNPNSHCGSNTLQVATIGPQLDVDYRDNPFLPTRGSFTRINFDFAHPSFGASQGVQFFKVDAGYTYYQRLGSPKWVWANSVHGGYERNLSDQAGSGIPTDWSFLLGGIYTVRGFDLSSPLNRIPKEGSGADAEHPTGYILGEANEKLVQTHSDYYLLKSELRVPLYDEWGGVIFYDGGAVHIRGYDFKRPYRDAIGFGIRYNTPVGPLAIDLAFKINPEKDEDAYKVHFSIGTF